MNVYMDDFRTCPRGFVLARSMDECLMLLEDYEIDILSLDYDLGWNEPNGADLARIMVQRKLFPRTIYLHSSSPYGRSAMYQILYQGKPQDVELYQQPMPDHLLEQIQNEASERGGDA